MNVVSKIVFVFLLVPILAFSQVRNYKKAVDTFEKGDCRKALTNVNKNLKKNPSSTEDLLLKSRVLFELEEYDGAVKILSNMGDLETEYRVILSTSLYETDQYDQAKAVFRTLLSDQEKDVIYNNIGGAFYNLEMADSAIYYGQKAVDLLPNDGMYRFHLGVAYALNDESDKACGQVFLSSKLGYHQAPEFYETQNCDSWKEQWLDKLSGRDRMTIENALFPLIKDKVIVTHRTYLFEEKRNSRELELVNLTELPVGVVFKFKDEQGRTIVRWADK